MITRQVTCTIGIEIKVILFARQRTAKYPFKSVDPHVHFADIAKYGYSTLEEFVNAIPVNAMTELIISRGIDANPGKFI